MKQLYTRWGKALQSEHVLEEYPRPLMVRDSYINLNGYWEYAFTSEFRKPAKYEGRILVPFSPESVLSGAGRQLKPDEYLWYRRSLEVEPGEYRAGERCLLHFGAVDQACVVYVNGHQVISHTGGYLPFEMDITDFLTEGSNELTVAVKDLSDTSYHSRGKQKLKRGGMFYTAQSGIWQTVWMEKVPGQYIQAVNAEPDLDSGKVRIMVKANADLPVEIEIHRPRMRTFTLETDAAAIPRICLNHEVQFQKGVLDQGYWPDGLYTAPSDEAFIFDIQSMKDMGFNMLRKHIKIEPQRWYYHCDRLGIVVWQDMVNGGSYYKHWFVTYGATALSWRNLRIKDVYTRLLSRENKDGRLEFIKEMKKTVELLKGHPSIAAWVIFNEGWGQFQTADMTEIVRKIDPARFIDQASGWFDQGGGDFQSIHNYFFKLRMKPEERRATVLSEFGGYSKREEGHSACLTQYGYGIYKDSDMLNKAYRKLEADVEALIPKGLCASVYTQLSDVEEEVNGIFTYDREVQKIKS